MPPRCLPPSPLKLEQVLDDLDHSSPTFRKCLRELRSVCGTRGVLPTSYALSSRPLDIEPEPFAWGGYGDVYLGSLDGSKVCMKRVQMHNMSASQRANEVCY